MAWLQPDTKAEKICFNKICISSCSCTILEVRRRPSIILETNRPGNEASMTHDNEVPKTLYVLKRVWCKTSVSTCVLWSRLWSACCMYYIYYTFELHVLYQVFFPLCMYDVYNYDIPYSGYISSVGANFCMNSHLMCVQLRIVWRMRIPLVACAWAYFVRKIHYKFNPNSAKEKLAYMNGQNVVAEYCTKLRFAM